MSNFVSIKAGAGMEELTIETKPGDGPVIGTGAHIWPGGRAAAVYLAGHARNVLANRVVLEVGSGTGLLGLVAAQLGAARPVGAVVHHDAQVGREALRLVVPVAHDRRLRCCRARRNVPRRA